MFFPLGILEHANNSSPGLQHSRPNLVGRQYETIGARVTELICVRVCSVTRNISVISRRPSSCVKCGTAGANRVGSTGDSTDSRLSASCEGAVLRVVLGAEAAVIAVWPEDVLAVRAGRIISM